MNLEHVTFLMTPENCNCSLWASRSVRMPNDSRQCGNGCRGTCYLSPGWRMVSQLREREELWDEALQYLRSREHTMHCGRGDVHFP